LDPFSPLYPLTRGKNSLPKVSTSKRISVIQLLKEVALFTHYNDPAKGKSPVQLKLKSV
jgi:hypothetical protein